MIHDHLVSAEPPPPGMSSSWQWCLGRLLFTKKERKTCLKDKIEDYPPGNESISPQKWHVEDDFPFPKVGYVNSLEGTLPKADISDKPKI